MQDTPSPPFLLAAVARFLRDEAIPALGRTGESALAYQARVAANMLDIAGRELLLSPSADAEELARLRQLVGDAALDDVQADADAGLSRLNQRLAERIASGALDAGSPGLTEHLWRTTLAKLAVDQPGYDTYRRLLAAEAGRSDDPQSHTP